MPRRARHVTTVALVLEIIGQRQPISIAQLSAQLPGIPRRVLYGPVCHLCRIGRLEIAGEAPREDGRGKVSLYAIAKEQHAAAPQVARVRAQLDPLEPKALLAAETKWLEVFRASSSRYLDTTAQQLRERASGKKVEK